MLEPYLRMWAQVAACAPAAHTCVLEMRCRCWARAAQVAGLRASRDKLLLELDEQAAEAQRLALENGVLQQARARRLRNCEVRYSVFAEDAHCC